jgi:hypothetical protein
MKKAVAIGLTASAAFSKAAETTELKPKAQAWRIAQHEVER